MWEDWEDSEGLAADSEEDWVGSEGSAVDSAEAAVLPSRGDLIISFPLRREDG